MRETVRRRRATAPRPRDGSGQHECENRCAPNTNITNKRKRKRKRKERGKEKEKAKRGSKQGEGKRGSKQGEGQRRRRGKTGKRQEEENGGGKEIVSVGCSASARNCIDQPEHVQTCACRQESTSQRCARRARCKERWNLAARRVLRGSGAYERISTRARPVCFCGHAGAEARQAQ